MPGIIKDLLEIPVSLRLKELLGISKDLSHAFTEQLRLRNPKQLTGSNLGSPPTENLPNKKLSGIKPNITPNRNQDRSPPAIGSKAHLVGSNPSASAAQVHYQNGNSQTSSNLIYTQWSCDGSAAAIESIIDTGSQINIINSALVTDFIRSPIEADTVKQIIVASSGAKELKGLIRGVSLRNGDIETFADFYIGEGVPFQVLLGRPWQVENKVSIEQRDTGAYLVFPTQGRSGKKLELPTATKPAHFDSTLLAATPFPYQEDPYDSIFDSETDSKPEDGPENSGSFGDAYTFNVQDYDEVSSELKPHSDSDSQDDNETNYYSNHQHQYPLQTYFGHLQADLNHYNPHGMTALSLKFLMELVEFIHKVIYWCKPTLNLFIAMLCALPSISQLVYAFVRIVAIFLQFLGILWLYKQVRKHKRKIFYHLLPKSSPQSNPAISPDLIDMSSPPVVLYTGSLHAVPGHEAYPAIDASIDEPASNALDRLATTITTWPPTTNDTWRFVHSLELPSYHVSFRDLEYYVQLADEAARAYTNQPLENRVLSIMSSNNTIELSGTGMDSLDFQQGVSSRLLHFSPVPFSPVYDHVMTAT